MVYKCINCGREIISFNCDCGRDKMLWDRYNRIAEQKIKVKVEVIKNNQKTIQNKKNLNKQLLFLNYSNINCKPKQETLLKR